MPTTSPAIVPTGVPPPFEGAAVNVADDVGCGVFDPDNAVVVVGDAVDEIVPGGAVAEEDTVVEASVMLK